MIKDVKAYNFFQLQKNLLRGRDWVDGVKFTAANKHKSKSSLQISGHCSVGSTCSNPLVDITS